MTNRSFRSFTIALCVLLQSSVVLAGKITPGANLVTAGIPPLSTDLIEQTRLYNDFRPTSFLDWHPVREEALVLSRPTNGQTPQIFYLSGALHERRQLTHFNDRVSDASFQPSEGRYFVFSKDVDGTEQFQLFRFDLKTGEITQLTDGKSKNAFGVWSNRGDQLAYTSNRRNGKDADFYVMNPLDPKSDHLVAELNGGEGWSILDWSPDDSMLLAQEYKSISESYLWLIDLAKNEKRLLTPSEGATKVAYSHAKFSRDGKSVFVVTDRNSEFLRLMSLDLSNMRFSSLTGDTPWNVESFLVSPKGSQILMIFNEAGLSKPHLLALNERQELVSRTELAGIPAGVISSTIWHKKSDLLGFSLSSARSPTDMYTLRLSDALLTRWTRTETNGVDPEQFPEAKLVSWKSFDGREITGFLHEPSRRFEGKRPVMIVIHGGPESQSRPTFLGRANYYLNEMGVALLFPNIRGSTGYGKTFLQLPNGLNRVSAYEDINSLLDWIKTQPNLDGNRILVSGGSYGGHVTLAVATRYNDKISCSIDTVGMSNLVTFLKNTEPYRQDLRRAIYGDERIPEVRAFLESIAPLNHADKITKPLFVIQGYRDPRVPYTEAEQMVKTVKDQGTPVWYLLAKDEGHGFNKKENQDYQFYSTIEFMTRCFGLE